jgi:hypothetical protein
MRLYQRIAQFTKSLAFWREAAIVLSGARFASFRVPTIKLASSSQIAKRFTLAGFDPACGNPCSADGIRHRHCAF